MDKRTNGTRWLTARNWWRRRTTRLPISTPSPGPDPDWTIEGRACWGGYCGESTQVWWVEPHVEVDQDHPSYLELEVGTVELEILSGLDILSRGGQGLLMSADYTRVLAERLLAAAAAAEAGVAALDAQPPVTDQIRVFGWADGDQVRHRSWQSVGTVRIITLDPTEAADAGWDTMGTVVWHGSAVTDQLHEYLAAELERA